MKAHYLRDRFGSRAYHLHIIESYGGQLKPDEFVTGLEKVENYLKRNYRILLFNHGIFGLIPLLLCFSFKPWNKGTSSGGYR